LLNYSIKNLKIKSLQNFQNFIFLFFEKTFRKGFSKVYILFFVI